MKLTPVQERGAAERNLMDSTLLEQIKQMEAAVHEKFPAEPLPTKEEIGEFLTERFPRMDGGLSTGIAIAGLILQAWKFYSDRKNQQKGTGRTRCPKCSEADIKRARKAGKLVCKHGYKI